MVERNHSEADPVFFVKSFLIQGFTQVMTYLKSTKTWNPESGNGNGNGNGIRNGERRFQAINLKKYIY